MSLVGIIANPSSGKDIRRLVSDATGLDNHHKANIVRRVLRGLAAISTFAPTEPAAISRVLLMPEPAGIGHTATSGLDFPFSVRPLAMPYFGCAEDSFEAARRLADDKADVIVVLGGDGTHRLVAKACGNIPLVPISTGTNNVWPRQNEGTLAGLAAGLIATGLVPPDAATRRTRRLDILRDGEPFDAALVDVAACDVPVPGARAIWDVDRIRQLVLALAHPGVLGLSSIGGGLPPPTGSERGGLALEIGDGGDTVLAPIAPGLVLPVPVRTFRWLEPGETVDITHRPGTLALDGERETIVGRDDHLAVRLEADGPIMVDVPATLELAAAAGCFIIPGAASA